MHLRLDAGGLERVAEALLDQRLAIGTADIGEMTVPLCGTQAYSSVALQAQRRSGERECAMRYKVKNIAALQIVLGDVPDGTRVEVDPHVNLSAKTVGALRKMTDWPEVLAITIPREGSSQSVVKVSKPSTATRTSPKQ